VTSAVTCVGEKGLVLLSILKVFPKSCVMQEKILYNTYKIHYFIIYNNKIYIILYIYRYLARITGFLDFVHCPDFWTKPRNPVTPNVIHHRQSPLDSKIFSVLICGGDWETMLTTNSRHIFYLSSLIIQS
jgi:hypothetical protein